MTVLLRWIGGDQNQVAAVGNLLQRVYFAVPPAMCVFCCSPGYVCILLFPRLVRIGRRRKQTIHCRRYFILLSLVETH
jgi:hypothetical protein